jgi:hypothetical protein
MYLRNLYICMTLAGSLLAQTALSQSTDSTQRHASCTSMQAPRVFLEDAQLLVGLKCGAVNKDKHDAVVASLVIDADKAMHNGPFSVMQKAVVPPSGDKHDYMSQAPYFWPDPAKKDGLPYIRRDGERNPEIKKISDHDNIGRMGADARTLALAYYLTGNEPYAARAAVLLRIWFISSSTRMNPNLEFGQGIPGINTGRGIGLIETRAVTSALDAAGLLAESPSWTASDQEALRTWVEQFLHWMRTSSKGKDEDAARNNHGTYYDLQVADYALFVGDRQLAVDTLERVKTRRIAVQIEPDGREPMELARTKAFSYSYGNLDGLMQLAWLGQQVGVDLWSFRTPDGRSIRAALDFLLPYAVGEMKWNYPQIDGFHGAAMLREVQMAAREYEDPRYIDALSTLGAGNRSVDALLWQMRSHDTMSNKN